MLAYVLILTEAGKAFDVLENVKKIEGVLEAYVVTGEFDVIAKVEAKDLKELGNKIVGKIQALKGVVRTLTALAVT